MDGTGKSTQAGLLAKSLRQEGHRVMLSREPTDGPFGRRLRESATSGRLSP
ncbi:MAG: dTMP kinase, partial [Roseibacillus sp.]|nr:dTMP kinase [Roseibacillus sp.]